MTTTLTLVLLLLLQSMSYYHYDSDHGAMKCDKISVHEIYIEERLYILYKQGLSLTTFIIDSS